MVAHEVIRTYLDGPNATEYSTTVCVVCGAEFTDTFQAALGSCPGKGSRTPIDPEGGTN